jgi:hypothetical protein
MAEGKTLAELKQVGFDENGTHESTAQCHVLSEVRVEQFKHKVQPSITLNAVLERDNVFMTQFPQETNLTKSRRGDTLALRIEPNALQGNNLICLAIPCLKHGGKGSFTQIGAWLFNFLIPL